MQEFNPEMNRGQNYPDCMTQSMREEIDKFNDIICETSKLATQMRDDDIKDMPTEQVRMNKLTSDILENLEDAEECLYMLAREMEAGKHDLV